MNKSVIFEKRKGFSFLLLCLVPLILFAHCETAAETTEQVVRINLEQKNLEKGAADLRYELPYEYSITVSPWLVRIFEASAEREPTSITWTGSHEFEITFDASHFGKKTVKAEREGDQWIARSGPLVGNPVNRRYRYEIQIWPDLPTPLDEKGKREIEEDRDQYYILIDPDYIIEDRP